MLRRKFTAWLAIISPLALRTTAWYEKPWGDCAQVYASAIEHNVNSKSFFMVEVLKGFGNQ
jgi:hypothetical protein